MDAVKNFAKGNLTAGITNAATSLTLATGKGAKFPGTVFNATLFNSTDFADPADDPAVEIVRVTAGFGTDTFTISRGQEGTAAVAHNTAGKTYTLVAGPTQKTMSDTNRTIISTVLGSVHTGVVTASDDLVIPANTLEVGDMVLIEAVWLHSGAMVSGPRFGIDFGSMANIVNMTGVGGTDTNVSLKATVVITGTTAQTGFGTGFRYPNGAGFGTACQNGTNDITANISVKFTYRMDATGENVQLLGATVRVIKKST